MILSGESKYVDGKKRYCPDVHTDGVIVRTTDGETMTLTAVLNGMEGRLDAGAEKLATPRTIAISGKATGQGVAFDGSADITIEISALDVSGSAATAAPLAPAEAAAVGASALFAREDHVHPAQADVSGNAGTATKLQTARAISFSGGATGSGSFDGSADVTIEMTPEAGAGLAVGDDKKLYVPFAEQTDATSADKAVSPAYVAGVIADLPTGGGSGGVDEAAVRRITLDVLDNYDFSINDTVVLNAVNKVLAGTDVGQINQRLDTLEAAFNVGGSSSTPYPGVSAIIAMEVPNDDFFLVSGIHDAANKRLMI